jgi:hypothetical protein
LRLNNASKPSLLLTCNEFTLGLEVLLALLRRRIESRRAMPPNGLAKHDDDRVRRGGVEGSSSAGVAAAAGVDLALLAEDLDARRMIAHLTFIIFAWLG